MDVEKVANEFKELYSSMQKSMVHLERLTELLLGEAPKKTAVENTSERDRKRFSGLTDGEFLLLDYWEEYNNDRLNPLTIKENPTAWEQSFMQDWCSKPSAQYELTEKQRKVFERVAEKLGFDLNVEIAPEYSTGKREEDYAADDIPF